MEVFRIAKESYQELDGTGGLFHPGRWHEKGNRVIYASEHRSLSAFEALVHLSKSVLLNNNFLMITIFIPNDAEILTIPNEILLPGWDSCEYKQDIQQFGTRFLKEKKYLMLKVPSVIIKQEFNYLINPAHPLFKDCKSVRSDYFSFDNRLVV
jgi:RES domain-containing protein